MLVLVCLKTVLISTQYRCRFVLNVSRAWKSFWLLSMELLGDMGQIEAHFGLFGDNVNQDAR
jgi:hypothetical protein